MSSLTDNFALLELPVSFDVDSNALEAAYIKAQRQYHPDRFVGKRQAERQQALQRSVDINNAYKTLKAPHSRAVYLLKVQGIDVTDHKEAQKPSQTLLMEIMEWRLQVEDAQSADALTTLETSLSGLQSEVTGHISMAFQSGDWEKMTQDTMRLGYILKTREAIAQQLKRLALQV